MKKLIFLIPFLVFINYNSQTIAEKQMMNARATGYAVVAAKNPGVDFSILVIPWDGINSLEYNANNQINSAWHAQAAIKGNYFHQDFQDNDFSKYSSVVTSEEDFSNYKSINGQWWIVCSTLPPFSSQISGKNGNIVIGTSNPQTKLQIVSNMNDENNGSFIIGNTDQANLRFGVNNGYSWIQSHAGSPLYINTIGNNVVITKEYGNVGIGTSNPQYKLEVAGSTAVKGVLYVHGPDLSLGKGDGRAQGNLLDQRALVHGDADILWLNYGGDFEGGTQIGNGSFFKNDGNASLQGKLEAKEVKVTTTPTADFVFEKDYQLPTLEEVEKHIKENKHLPEIASAKQMEKEGVNVGEFQIKLLQKIEELTLYSIEQNKKIIRMEKLIKKLSK